MKRNKKVSYKKTQQRSNLRSKSITVKQQPTFKKNYFNIWLALGLMVFIGLISFFNYLSADFLFYFKDIGSDSLNQNYPAVVQRFNILLEDTRANWSFYEGIGTTFSNTMATDPYVLFLRFGNSIGASIFGVNFYIYGSFIKLFITHFLFSGIIFYFFQRTISTNKFSSVIGAVLLTFSGYMVVGSSWGFSSYIFQAVFLLFAFEQLYVKNRWYFFPFAALFLSNNLFIMFIYSLFLLLYFIFRFLSSKEQTIKDFFVLTGKMIALGIIGIIMNTANAYHYFLKIFLSPRVSGNASYSQTLSGGEDIIEQSNLGATTILRFFSNDIIGTGSNFKGWQNYFEAPLFYIGLLTLLLVPQVFIHLNKRKKIIFGSFLGFWILTLLIPYLRHAFLAFTGDYFRFGFDFFIPFTLLFFAVYALNKLDSNFKLNIPLLGGTLVVLLAALFFPYNSIPAGAINSNLQTIIAFLLLLYSVLIFLMSKPQYKSYAQIAILLLVVVELSYFSYKSYEDRVPVKKTEFTINAGGYKDGSIKAVEYIKNNDPTPFFRTEKDYQSGNAIHGSLNDAMAQGYYGTSSYSSFNQLNYVRFLEEIELIQKGDETTTRWLTGFRGNPLLQTFGNVKYHLSKSENPEFIRFGFEQIHQIGDVKILQNKFSLPFGYTYDSYIDFKDFKSLIQYSITKQGLDNLFTDLSRSITAEKINPILIGLQTITNKVYSNKESFDKAVQNATGISDPNILRTIRKYSTLNFRNQIALLNAFVYEDDSNIDISEMNRINATDTSILVPAQKFNFELYENFVSERRKDTLQIEKFTNSKILGSIELTKKKLLFFTIPYDKGWKIKVNGNNKELSRVNIGFTGIMLPKGKHEIELYYIPQYSRLTFGISIVSIIIFWLYLGFYLFRKRKKQNLNKNTSSS